MDLSVSTGVFFVCVLVFIEKGGLGWGRNKRFQFLSLSPPFPLAVFYEYHMTNRCLHYSSTKLN